MSINNVEILEKSTQSGIKLIAKLANVSIGTVDRVLHNRPGVAEDTKVRVLKVVEQLNYKPNIIARRLVSKKKYTFAVLHPEITNHNPYWKLYEAGIKKAESEIIHLGIFVERLHFNQDEPTSYSARVDQVINGNYDGVILVPFFVNETVKLLQHCKSNNIPFVYFDTVLKDENFQPLSSIVQDHVQSGYFAGKFASYLLSSNDTALAVSINIVKKASNHTNYLQREEGFRKFAEESKKFKVEYFHYNNIEDGSSRELEEKLISTIRNNPSIKVLFVTNSRAYKVASILEKHSINNLRILGYDLIDSNIEALKKGTIDFLISQESFDQGYLGVYSLYNYLILNQKVEKDKLMPITLIMKENLSSYHTY